MSCVRRYICDALRVIVICQGILLLGVKKKVISFFEPKPQKKRFLFQRAPIPVTVPWMGHVIKNGIRAFPVP